uniref:Secreted protein n=1 Tax=Anguilla anguilla TaxID=7936 RepID=A0A0E9USF4_ANGAN
MVSCCCIFTMHCLAFYCLQAVFSESKQCYFQVKLLQVTPSYCSVSVLPITTEIMKLAVTSGLCRSTHSVELCTSLLWTF